MWTVLVTLIAVVQIVEIRSSKLNDPLVSPALTSDGRRLYEGDLLLSQDEADFLYGSRKRKATPFRFRLWPQGIVHYSIQESARWYEANIRSAIAHWQNNTCLKFIEISKDMQDRPHIIFTSLGSCYSVVGMRDENKGQEISIHKDCLFGTGSVVHEMGHAIGFYHEHNRPDRDRYITIITGNVKPNVLVNFKPLKLRTYNVPYDVTSIMHYNAYAGSKNGEKTIVPLDSSLEDQMGQRKTLSFLDAKLANLMYKCEDSCTQKPECPVEGFITSNCQCICPKDVNHENCHQVTPIE